MPSGRWTRPARARAVGRLGVSRGPPRRSSRTVRCSASTCLRWAPRAAPRATLSSAARPSLQHPRGPRGAPPSRRAAPHPTAAAAAPTDERRPRQPRAPSRRVPRPSQRPDGERRRPAPPAPPSSTTAATASATRSASAARRRVSGRARRSTASRSSVGRWPPAIASVLPHRARQARRHGSSHADARQLDRVLLHGTERRAPRRPPPRTAAPDRRRRPRAARRRRRARSTTSATRQRGRCRARGRRPAPASAPRRR